MYKIYGTPGCGYCIRAKQLLTNLEIDHEYIDLTEVDKEEQMRLMRIAKIQFRTVPQIFTTDEEYVGGYTELEKRLK